MGDFRDWIAFYAMDDSMHNPEPTKWDSDAVKAAKLRRIAQSKLG